MRKLVEVTAEAAKNQLVVKAVFNNEMMHAFIGPSSSYHPTTLLIEAYKGGYSTGIFLGNKYFGLESDNAIVLNFLQAKKIVENFFSKNDGKKISIEKLCEGTNLLVDLSHF